ncbi:MAG: hypothetical protein RL557_240 [archaeon]|jgi:flagellin-like protein
MRKRGRILKDEKAISPIVSTVLLIMIVIVIALIIIFWARGFVSELIEKDIGGNVKRINEYCNEVELVGNVNEDNSFGFENVGNVPLFGFSLKLTDMNTGKSQLLSFTQEANINPGFGINLDSSFDSKIKGYSTYEEVIVIPILLGKAEGGTKQFQCPEENGLAI